MICKNYSDSIRKDYRVYLEPIIAFKSNEAAEKIGCKTMSKYIRYAVICQLFRDGFKLSEKFEPFRNVANNNSIDKGVTYNR